tara:strand:+ start:747 stop:3068 length:2322 start_codon:yes stop_codon:yes gene_type:complete
MNLLKENKKNFKFWDAVAAMIDQSIDIALNHAQSGHPGGSRSKVPLLLSTLLSGVMKWDIRNPGATFGDRFTLVAGHTNPVVYATLAVLNEALRIKYQETKNNIYLNPLGDKYTLYYEDLLNLRRKDGLPGHAEMEGKTLFFKFNTGPTGHGAAPAVGQAFALKYSGANQTKVFALEGEGGLTAGVTHEARISSYGLKLENLIYMLDWNDFGIDNRPFSQIKAGTPKDWFEPYGWKVSGTENGEDWESILNAYSELFSDEKKDRPKAIWVKTRKGRGYLKYDSASHGTPHKRNSNEFWDTKKEFSERYGVDFKYMDQPSLDNEGKNKSQMKETLESVLSLYKTIPGLADYVADRLIKISESIHESDQVKNKFKNNPFQDEVLYDFKNYPASLFKNPGEIAPNRAAFGHFGSWINSYVYKKYNRPLALVCSADLAGSTNIAGFSKGWMNDDDFGMYNPKTNNTGTLLPQGITEFANAGIMTGISSVNLSNKPFDNFNGYITACSTYGSFSYLKYGAYRLYSQLAQDSQLKVGKTIWVAGHSGPETAEDSRTHFGIFAPGVTQMFPDNNIINIHPWEYNEVPVMLGAALSTDIPIIALHLTRPPIEIPDRKVLKMPSHFDAAKGAYVLKKYDKNKPKQGVVIVRGTSVISELCKILPELNSNGPNIKIVAALSWTLFNMQSKKYQESVMKQQDWFDSMIITNTSLNNMRNWIKHPLVKKYSLSPDWDNRWRFGGNLKEVIDEAHLSSDWQQKAIDKFMHDRNKRLETLKNMLPED